MHARLIAASLAGAAQPARLTILSLSFLHPQAQYNLGAAYHNGLGVAQDRKEAERWLRKAAAQGDKQAQQVLADLYSSPAPEGPGGEECCLRCLQPVAKVKLCSRCKTAVYCSVECQRKHWPEHKRNCA